MGDLSENTVARLRSAGWHENYSYDMRKHDEAYAKMGCPLPEPVIQFLRRYHGITLRGSHFMDFEFFAELPRPEIDSCSDYDNCCPHLGLTPQPLYVIGYAALGNVTLLMNDTGQVYAVNPLATYFAFLGKDGEDAVEALCSGRHPQELSA